MGAAWKKLIAGRVANVPGYMGGVVLTFAGFGRMDSLIGADGDFGSGGQRERLGPNGGLGGGITRRRDGWRGWVDPGGGGDVLDGDGLLGGVAGGGSLES